MRTHYGVVKYIAKLGLTLMLGVSMSACGGGNEEWKEEVQLSDGRVIVVEREMLRKGGGDEWASNRSGSMPKEYRIRFSFSNNSSTQTIEWRSTKISPQTWPEVPLILDVVAEQPVVYTLVAISAGCEVYSKYVYRDGKWLEEALPEQFEPKATNLLFGSQRNLPATLSLERKRGRNSGGGYRNALKQVGPKLKVCG